MLPESELPKVSESMSDDRLKVLLRQKSLLEEHLKWIENEIAREKGSDDAPPTPEDPLLANRLAPTPADNSTPTPTNDEPDQTTAVPDIYESLGPDTKSSAKSARLGCIVLFAAAFLVLGGIIWLVYHIY